MKRLHRIARRVNGVANRQRSLKYLSNAPVRKSHRELADEPVCGGFVSEFSPGFGSGVVLANVLAVSPLLLDEVRRVCLVSSRRRFFLFHESHSFGLGGPVNNSILLSNGLTVLRNSRQRRRHQ